MEVKYSVAEGPNDADLFEFGDQFGLLLVLNPELKSLNSILTYVVAIECGILLTSVLGEGKLEKDSLSVLGRISNEPGLAPRNTSWWW